MLLIGIASWVEAQPEAIEPECGCLWRGSFTQVAAETDLVVLGEVRTIKGNAVDLQVEKIMRGEFWLESLRVWMKTNTDCRPPVEHFPEGSRWIMALEKIEVVPEDGFNPFTPNHSYGRVSDYILSSCGGFWLKVNGSAVTGNLVPGMPRFYHSPDMAPVLIDLVSAYLAGQIDITKIIKASREHPEELNNLIFDTRSFLRGQDLWLED